MEKTGRNKKIHSPEIIDFSKWGGKELIVLLHSPYTDTKKLNNINYEKILPGANKVGKCASYKVYTYKHIGYQGDISKKHDGFNIGMYIRFTECSKCKKFIKYNNINTIVKDSTIIIRGRKFKNNDMTKYKDGEFEETKKINEPETIDFLQWATIDFYVIPLSPSIE